jgi:hypothetical protein
MSTSRGDEEFMPTRRRTADGRDSTTDGCLQDDSVP